MEQSFEEYLKAGQMTVSNMILNNYRKLGMTEIEFILFLEIDSQLQQGVDLPDIKRIVDALGCSNTRVYELIHSLLEKKLLSIISIEDDSGKKKDKYSWTLLYQKLDTILRQENKNTQQQQLIKQQQDTYKNIEVEFGRALSPIEIQTIDIWFKKDHYAPEIVNLALREAVLNQVYNLRYIDRILISWEKQNIKTVADVQRISQKQRSKYNSIPKKESRIEDKKPNIPLYHWSEGKDGDNNA
ncbi:DnaD domain protein [Ligilactobacillus sp. WILCCON 0076]|uniref:DnaD domain protein n=1 Tax=Ligilactobacillus ubinensis TaxID=2876789 RepID=A0A9X2FL54_9LACO|nr:DnaD domain protein [Ligilactobacillus ubinensis]MCP0887707.1 DnaD domain protein [Ligilactobacillus ubinensis]